MWKCTNCRHTELSSVKPDHYPVCGICGYASDDVLPDKFPICEALKAKFRRKERKWIPKHCAR